MVQHAALTQPTREQGDRAGKPKYPKYASNTSQILSINSVTQSRIIKHLRFLSQTEETELSLEQLALYGELQDLHL